MSFTFVRAVNFDKLHFFYFLTREKSHVGINLKGFLASMLNYTAVDSGVKDETAWLLTVVLIPVQLFTCQCRQRDILMSLSLSLL